jgi:hypothetical protein
MTELERALVALGHELEFPPTPDLVAGVRERLQRRRWRRPLVFAVALGVIAFGIAMAVPPARSAILRFFHIGAATIERVETLPPAQQRPLTAALGPALARREAELRAHLHITLPAGVRPAQYYARPGLIATLLRVDGKPVLLAEMRGDQVVLSKKFAAPQTHVEPVRIGNWGLWISGGEHVLRWTFGPAPMKEVPTRLAGNVLIWLADDRTYRLEGDVGKQRMLELGREITQ